MGFLSPDMPDPPKRPEPPKEDKKKKPPKPKGAKDASKEASTGKGKNKGLSSVTVKGTKRTHIGRKSSSTPLGIPKNASKSSRNTATANKTKNEQRGAG